MTKNPPSWRASGSHGLAVSLVLVVLSQVSCSSQPIDDEVLTILYDRAASFQYPDRNPIIVIPGFTGSRLVDETTGEVVWGAFNRAALGFGDDADIQRFALPLRETDPRPAVYPDGVLDTLELNVAGLPFELKAYVPILQALGTGGYRDESLGKSGAIDYGDDHFTCFQFDYDWRLDIAENARRFHDFVIAKREQVRLGSLRRFQVEPRSLQFDVVAHSMGALLLRYYLRYGPEPLPDDGPVPPPTWAGAEHIERAILIGPPNAGSAVAMERLVDGVWFTPGVPTAVFGTWPASYQMLPRARHHAVVVEGTGVALDPFDPALWIRAGFGLADPDQDDVLQVLLPDVENPAERRRVALETLERHLRGAERFHQALDQPATPPAGTELHLVTSDSRDTDAVVAVDLDKSSVRIAEKRQGDGLVLRSSALHDERIGDHAFQPKVRSPIDWSSVMFVSGKHFQLTRDPQFTNNLLYRLLEEPRRLTRPGAPLALDASDQPLTAEAIIAALGLEPHPEGGFYTRTYREPRDLPLTVLGEGYNGPRPMATAIYYLLVPETFSELHRLDSDEIWHHYAGDTVEQLQLDDVTGNAALVRIGRDLAAGERPQLVVRRGVWQGTRLVSGGEHGWALMGTTMAPGFDFAGYRAGERDELIHRWPEWRALIEQLTRR